MSFVTDDKALTYLRRFKQKLPLNLREKYPQCSDDALRMLSNMLQFNPFYRPSVDELIRDSYFDDVRQFAQAYDCPEQIAFDFEDSSKQYVGLKQIRDLFIQEINYYRALKTQGLSEVSPAPVKNGNVQIFFNSDNAYQLKAKTTTPETAGAQKAAGNINVVEADPTQHLNQ